MSIGKNLKRIREDHGLTQAEMGKIAGVSDKAVSTWESEQKVPRMGAIQKIADYFHIAKSAIVDDEQPQIKGATAYNPTHRIPILGRISAGLPLYADEHIEGYTYTELNGGAEYFALRVIGDSMDAARIHDGDLLIVRRQDIVDNGDIAVVLVGDDDATVKRFYREGNTVTLMPQSTNPEHKPQIYDAKTTRICIQGRVVKNEISY